MDFQSFENTLKIICCLKFRELFKVFVCMYQVDMPDYVQDFEFQDWDSDPGLVL